jgi:NAD(P)-dependent dehydrogenase (short-subunit alcohol dehydrogenase family)
VSPPTRTCWKHGADLCPRHGLFNLSKRALPQLLESVDDAPHPPSLIITGATASLRGSSKFAYLATGKFAVRAMTQSMAREFGPKGVHVAHAIIDGVIDTPRTKAFGTGVPDSKLSPDAVCEFIPPLDSWMTNFGIPLPDCG